MISTLEEDNFLTIPVEIVDQFGLQEGSRLKWSHGDRPGTLLVEVIVQELIDERIADDLPLEG